MSGQSDEQYEVDNCKIKSESTLRSLIPFHWTPWRLKRIIFKTTDKSAKRRKINDGKEIRKWMVFGKPQVIIYPELHFGT